MTDTILAESVVDIGEELMGRIVTVSGYLIIGHGRVTKEDPNDSLNFEMTFDAALVPNEPDKKMYDLIFLSKYQTDYVLPILEADFYQKVRTYCPEMQILLGSFWLFIQPAIVTGKIVPYDLDGETNPDIKFAITELTAATIFSVPPEQTDYPKGSRCTSDKVVIPFG
jgi:hypothetical protein